MSNPIFLHDNRLRDTTSLTASTVDASDTAFNVLNVIDRRPYTFWQSGTSTGLKYITIDTSNTTAAADAFCISGHNINTAGGSISIQNSSDNFGTIATVSTFTPSNDFTVMTTFSSASNRYWRFAINQPTSVKIKIGVGIIGNKFELAQAAQRSFNPDAHKVTSEGVDSKTLHPLGVTIRGRKRGFKIALSGVASTWITDTLLPQWDSWMHKSEPAGFAWNIGVESTATYYMNVKPNSAFVSDYLEATEFRNLSLDLEGRYESS